MNKSNSDELIFPVLPLRDVIVFPNMVIPLFVGREKSIKALQEVMKSDKSIVLITQKNSEIDDPEEKDLFGYGCLSKVLQLLKLPDGTVKVLVEGEKRVKILKHNKKDDKFLTCEVEVAEDQNVSKDLDSFAEGLVKKYEKLLILNKKDFNDATNNLNNQSFHAERVRVLMIVFGIRRTGSAHREYHWPRHVEVAWGGGAPP